MSIIIVEYYSEFYSPAVDESMIEMVDKFMEFLEIGISKMTWMYEHRYVYLRKHV